jgi:hypothetical protein
MATYRVSVGKDYVIDVSDEQVWLMANRLRPV